MNNIALAGSAGIFKGVFVHGVTSCLERNRLPIQAYSAASSSIVPCSFAAVGTSEEVGLEYWLYVLNKYTEYGNDIADAVIDSINKYKDTVTVGLDHEYSKELIIAVSKVVNAEAAEITQSSGAQKLGKRLMREAILKRREWSDNNLEVDFFCTKNPLQQNSLHKENFLDVAYASTRMLHAWKEPAEINGQAYIDASYTCSCPVGILDQRGYENIIAVGVEPGAVYSDIYRTNKVSDFVKNGRLFEIVPEVNLTEMGVDYLSASPEGLKQAYEHGWDMANKFLTTSNLKESK